MKHNILVFVLAFFLLAGCAGQPVAEVESQEGDTPQEFAALQEQLEEQEQENQRLQSQLEALRKELSSQDAEASGSEEAVSESETSEVEESLPEVSAAEQSQPMSATSAAPASAASAPVSSAPSAPAAGSSKSSDAAIFFADVELAIYDWITPAVAVVSSQAYGTSYIDANGNTLADVVSGKVNYSGTEYSYDIQGALDAFNDYRGVPRQAMQSGIYSSREEGTPNIEISATVEPVDTDAYAREVVQLANKERVSAGLDELDIDESMMQLAAIRAEELATKYSHERPDGTRVSTSYSYGEIINRKTSTPSGAVTSWMGSSGHKELMLAERYQSTGAGCYQDANGVFHWVLIFSK